MASPRPDSSVLHRAITDGLLPLKEDTEVDHVAEAAGDFSNVLGEDRVLLQSVVRAITDPASGETAPGFTEAAEALSNRWRVFRAKYAQGASEIIRVVLIQAVDLLVSRDTEAAALVWYAGEVSLRSLPAHSMSGAWSTVVERAGAIASEAAARRWGVSNAEIDIASIPTVKLDIPPIPAAVAANWIGKRVASATGLSNYKNEAVAPKNNYSPDHGSEWSAPFTDEMAAVLTDLIKHVQTTNGESVATHVQALQSTLTSFATGVRGAVRGVLREVISRQSILDRRSLLLWWSRALHSPSLDVSYRTLTPALVPFVAAVDLQRLVGGVAPLSIESLLREAVIGLGVEAISVADIAAALSENRETVDPLARGFAVDINGDAPIVRRLAAYAVKAEVDSNEDDHEKAEAHVLAVSIYRSAQAHALAYHGG